MIKGSKYQNFFSDLYNSLNIIDARLQIFCRFVIATLTAANTGGIFDDVLLQLTTTYTAYFGDSKSKTVITASRQGSTSSLNILVRSFADAVRTNYNLIASVFPKGTEPYAAFFPGGLSEFSRINRGNVLEITNRFSVAATRYKTPLGGQSFADIFTGYDTNINASLGTQIGNKGAVKTISSEVIEMRSPVEDALMAVMFAVGKQYSPNWVKCNSFFDFSLLFGSHHTTGITLKGTLDGKATIECSTDPVTGYVTFILKNKSKGTFSFFLTAVILGPALGNNIVVLPETMHTAVFTDFNAPAGMYLNVTNTSDTQGDWQVKLE